MNETKAAKGRTKRSEGTVSARHFDIEASMDCGQIFGWHREDGTYYGTIGSAAVILRQAGDHVHFVSDRAIAPDRISSFLGLDEDLEAIRAEIARDRFIAGIVASVRGLRILRQDAWPCLCSYIISANNRVDRIDLLVKEIARRFGKPRSVDGRKVYTFPGPADLATCSEPGVRSCGVGFRAPYLVEAARMVALGELDLEAIRLMDEQEGRQVLKSIPGVGDKIADCVQLFAFSKYRAFPVDVWIKRVIEEVYFHSCSVSAEEVRRFGQSYFGRYAGYAQEYIYYYARKYGLDA